MTLPWEKGRKKKNGSAEGIVLVGKSKGEGRGETPFRLFNLLQKRKKRGKGNSRPSGKNRKEERRKGGGSFIRPTEREEKVFGQRCRADERSPSAEEKGKSMSAKVPSPPIAKKEKEKKREWQTISLHHLGKKKTKGKEGVKDGPFFSPTRKGRGGRM